MIRAVIFDCFGVLVTEGWLPFKRRHFGHGTEQEREITALHRQVDAGLADFRGFADRVAELAHVPAADVLCAFARSVPDEDLFAYIADNLKPKYKIAMLSNVASDRLAQLFVPDQIALFDVLSLSYQTGYVKPDPRAFRTVAEQLGLEPEECVFTDDQERLCTAACEFGMQAITYHNFEQFKLELERILDADSSSATEDEPFVGPGRPA